MNIIGKLRDKIARYIDVYIKLVKLNFIEGTSKVLGYFIFTLIGLFIFFCILLFLGFGLTEVFDCLVKSKMLAFFMTTGIYLLVLLWAMLWRKKIIRFFAGSFIKILTEGENEEDDDKENDQP